jgi:hypothetical protein
MQEERGWLLSSIAKEVFHCITNPLRLRDLVMFADIPKVSKISESMSRVAYVWINTFAYMLIVRLWSEGTSEARS